MKVRSSDRPGIVDTQPITGAFGRISMSTVLIVHKATSSWTDITLTMSDTTTKPIPTPTFIASQGVCLLTTPEGCAGSTTHLIVECMVIHVTALSGNP